MTNAIGNYTLGFQHKMRSWPQSLLTAQAATLTDFVLAYSAHTDCYAPTAEDMQSAWELDTSRAT